MAVEVGGKVKKATENVSYCHCHRLCHLPSAEKCQSAKVCSKIHKISVRPSSLSLCVLFVYVAVCLFLFLWLFLSAKITDKRCWSKWGVAHLHVGCAQVLCEKAFVHGIAFNVCKQTPVRMRDMWRRESTAHYHVHRRTYHMSSSALRENQVHNERVMTRNIFCISSLYNLNLIMI